MKILFVVYETLLFERLGVMCLSARLKACGHETRLAFATGKGNQDPDRIFREYAPDIVAYSLMTCEYPKIRDFNREMQKKYSFLSVFGGPHPTYFPQIIFDEHCDAVCVGEGDLAFPEFCNRFENGGEYWETPNFVVRYDGKVYQNPMMPPVKNLDELPFADREIMCQAEPLLRKNGFKIFFGSRGCPYCCTYCYNWKYKKIYSGIGQFPNYRSPSNLVEEIEAVREQYPLKSLYMDDDTFLAKPDGWIEEFADLYGKRVGLPMTCNVRANLVTRENMALLKNAGLSAVWMGVECGDEKVAKEILGRNITNRQIMEAGAIIQDAGVRLNTLNMVGMPVDNSFETDLSTLDLNIRLKPFYAGCSILYPYPGTKIEQYAREKGKLTLPKEFCLETNNRSSMFDFQSKQEKLQVENLNGFFGIAVRFPFLRKHVKTICSLPVKTFFTFLYYAWYGYYFRVYFHPFVSFRQEIRSHLNLLVRLVRKT